MADHSDARTFREELAAVSAKVEQRLKELEAKEARWQEAQKAVVARGTNAQDKIKLNVGGALFETSRSSLLRFQGTYFSALLGQGTWQPDATGRDSPLLVLYFPAHLIGRFLAGSYFIDRDPTHFDRILDYMRTGKLAINGLSVADKKRLLDHLDYLQIPSPENLDVRTSSGKAPVLIVPQDSLANAITWDPATAEPRKIILSNDDKTATRIASEEKRETRLLTVRPVTKFEVRIFSGKCTFIGFAPARGPPQGWYLVAHEKYGLSDTLAYPVAACHMEEGSTVTAEFNPIEHTISFQADGRPIDLVFRNVNHEELHGAVVLMRQGATVSLL